MVVLQAMWKGPNLVGISWSPDLRVQHNNLKIMRKYTKSVHCRMIVRPQYLDLTRHMQSGWAREVEWARIGPMSIVLLCEPGH